MHRLKKTTWTEKKDVEIKTETLLQRTDKMTDIHGKPLVGGGSGKGGEDAAEIRPLRTGMMYILYGFRPFVLRSCEFAGGCSKSTQAIVSTRIHSMLAIQNFRKFGAS